MLCTRKYVAETCRQFSRQLSLCKQVCVELPSSALNMTLPAFAAERRRLQLSIDIIDLLRQLAAQIFKKNIHTT